ncbi:TetR/AcrR family transcriptional regulator [Truepera radiovictrix]|uniref:Transcriptional regulator, TetR family n=1 Tax=Truepera radiovictrix (strain DSM 17093 / CIP 108686 / LMG 22925 / RQ-24) TaxID=649638 RepID=D7CXA9_TRURR|nr:TetR/AcrR family transcriptional regulator [Truepera radiovictrix]ADI13233.1 transcriptional regulator, TetR family [Truepera radiovictrix DSM 17093]WMT58203.1 TetR/AcrR family transcriptional regulator [Truepera radiovictrix]
MTPTPLKTPKRAAGEDLRVTRTRRALGEALVALTLERGFEHLSVRDLAERAGVGYATFFRHYASKEALLEAVSEATLRELTELLGPLSATDDPRGAGTRLFRHAAANAALYRVLLRTRHHGPLQRALEVAARSFRETFDDRPGSAVPLEVAAHHVVHACVALLEWWLERDMPYPPERMGDVFGALIVGPTKAALQAKG